MAHMVKAVLGDCRVIKMHAIPLLNNSNSHQISAMSDDVNEQLISMLKTSKKFATQLDESTDVANRSVLVVYVGFINPVSVVIERDDSCY
jgi:hypothetical protein